MSRRARRGARPMIALRSMAVGLALSVMGCFPDLPGRLGASGADGSITDTGPSRDVDVDSMPEPGDVFVPGLDMDMDMTPIPERDVMPEPEPDMAPDPEPDMAPDPEPDMAPDPEPDMAPDIDMGLEVDMAPPDMAPPEAEVCNGLDDDRNGVIDDALVCGRFIAENCRAYLGWSDLGAGPADGSPSWGACPEAESDDFALDPLACRGTGGDSRFRRISMPGDVRDDDAMGVAFRCEGGPPGVSAWLQAQCTVWLGQADRGRAGGEEAYDDWGGCIARDGTGEPLDDDWVCDSSGGDGLFHRISLIGNVGGDDAFGVAFRCNDPDDEARAAAAQASAAVIFAWDRQSTVGTRDGASEWGDCPGAGHDVTDNSGDRRCASSAFDGRFHRFETVGNVDIFDAFGIALLPHPDAP